MRAKNVIVKDSMSRPQQKASFSVMINSDSWKTMINKSLGSPSKAAAFTATLISIVSSSPELQECEHGSIISAALQGEAANLSLALGQFSVVPYNDQKTGTKKAQYQISYKGLSQLATRSGEYKRIKVRDVREGEYAGIDPLTGDPKFDWMDDDEREDKPLAGIYAFYVLHNGFTNSVYWSHEKILNHANRYSQPFKGKKELYEKMNAGLEKRPANGSPWFDEPLSEGHLKMCKKTVLKQLFNDGIAPLSIEMQRYMKQDDYAESGQQVIFEDDERVTSMNKAEAVAQEAEVGEAEIIDVPAEAKDTDK